MSEQEKALARVIEPGASTPAPKRLAVNPTVEEWIPKLKRYDQEFDELPWIARSLIFTLTDPEDMKALCGASKLFSQYCKSPSMDDFWRQRIAEKFELQKIRNAAMPFKRKQQEWTKNWLPLKPIPQWSLEEFNSFMKSCQGEDEEQKIKPATSWFTAWLRTTDKGCSLVDLAWNLDRDAEDPNDFMRTIFLYTKLVYPPPTHTAYLDYMIDVLANWNFVNSKFGKPVIGPFWDWNSRNIEMTYNFSKEIVVKYRTILPEMTIRIRTPNTNEIREWTQSFDPSELEARIFHIDRYIPETQ